MIRLTNDYMRSAAARAVPGAYWCGEEKAWVVDHPEPRSAMVALKLFPELMDKYPVLVELRDSLLQDARPVDYASQLKLRIGAPRVRAAMAERGWSLSKAAVQPLGVGLDYQEIDLGYIAAVLRKHGGAYLGWSRGLGKTIGTAAIIDELDLKSTLIIAPNTSKTSVWADELAWACPWLEVVTMPNDAKKRVKALERAQYLHRSGTAFVLVVHYEALALIAGKTKKPGKRTITLGDGWKKLKINWDLIAADEGHRLASPDTLQSRAARKIPSRMRLVMSGSVFLNRWEELFGPLAFLYPTRYKSRWRDWNNRFLDFVENGYGRICVGILEHRVEDMRDELGRFMIVRDKESQAVTREVLVPLSPEQRRVYDQMAETLLAELPDGTRIKSSVGIAVLTRLRQIACGLDTLSEHVVDSAKLDAAIAVVQEHWDRGDDYVIFGWYRAAAKALQRRLATLGIEAWLIDGDVSQKQRTEIVRAFQSGQHRVLIGTLATMSESLNLQRANHVIRVDRAWTPATNQQAADRCDRQGQVRQVYLTDIIAADTVDDLVVMPALANKEALRSIVLGGRA